MALKPPYMTNKRQIWIGELGRHIIMIILSVYSNLSVFENSCDEKLPTIEKTTKGRNEKCRGKKTR